MGTLEGIFNFLNSGLRLVPEQRVHAHDDARRAKPTLGSMAFGNSFLKGTEGINTVLIKPPSSILRDSVQPLQGH